MWLCVCVVVFVCSCRFFALLVGSVSSCYEPVFVVARVAVEACTLVLVQSALLFIARFGYQDAGATHLLHRARTGARWLSLGSMGGCKMCLNVSGADTFAQFPGTMQVDRHIVVSRCSFFMGRYILECIGSLLCFLM